MAIPTIVSVDDHVIEPPHVWQTYLPQRFKEDGPRVERKRGQMKFVGKTYHLVDDPEGDWADVWIYDNTQFAINKGLVASSFERDDMGFRPVMFEEMLPGCYDRGARLADLDRNHTEASLCFPTFARFCGQTFLEASDKELAAACVRAYNDWMIDEWCADEARGRLIPMTLIPLWDAQLAADEVRRCAAKGSHAICFSEGPADLGLPSVFTDYWEPLWAACEETETVVNMHIGSSSKFRTTSPDAPHLVTLALTFEGASRAFVDWLCSGILERHKSIKIVLSEGQAGWMPFVMERLDHAWDHARAYSGVAGRLPNPPSSYIPGRVYACIFDDFAGLALREELGMSQIMFETDFPHGDSTWPHSKDVAEDIVTRAGLDEVETRQLLRTNAIDCYNLGRFGLSV